MSTCGGRPSPVKFGRIWTRRRQPARRKSPSLRRRRPKGERADRRGRTRRQVDVVDPEEWPGKGPAIIESKSGPDRYPSACSVLPPTLTGLALISTKAIVQASLPRLTQL